VIVPRPQPAYIEATLESCRGGVVYA